MSQNQAKLSFLPPTSPKWVVMSFGGLKNKKWFCKWFSSSMSQNQVKLSFIDPTSPKWGYSKF